jgi:hypothetical protein
LLSGLVYDYTSKEKDKLSFTSRFSLFIIKQSKFQITNKLQVAKEGKKIYSSGMVLVFVSVNIWRSLISCQTMGVKRHLFSKQVVVCIISR